MLVLDKRKISNVAIAIILGVSIFFIGKNPESILPTSSLPISEHTIVLDAGHGQPDRSEQSVKMVYQKKKLTYKLYSKFKNF